VVGKLKKNTNLTENEVFVNYRQLVGKKLNAIEIKLKQRGE
jgi:uncharacterized transporter YbjL